MSFCLDSVLIPLEHCSPSRAGCIVAASVQENNYAFTFCSAITVSEVCFTMHWVMIPIKCC